jgi:hypothetical protein
VKVERTRKYIILKGKGRCRWGCDVKKGGRRGHEDNTVMKREKLKIRNESCCM